MKLLQVIPFLFSISSVAFAQDFCSATGFTGQSVKSTGHDVSKIGNIAYEQWADGGNNSATFYSDGSFKCNFSNTKDYLCRSGVSFSARYPDDIGHIKASYKLVKKSAQNVGYSYVGVYGWTLESGISGVYEYYIVDNWLSQWRPGDWVGNTKYGDFTIDGGQYTVYKNVNGNLTQYFSLRKTERTCGTIDVTAHFEQWKKLGLKMPKITEIKVLAEAGNTGGGCSGAVEIPYAKIYINGKDQDGKSIDGSGSGNGNGQGSGNGNGNNNNQGNNNGGQSATGQCPATITSQGYKCCSKNCQTIYRDESGDWGVENNEWCGCGSRVPSITNCPSSIKNQGYKCCTDSCEVVYTDADGDWGVENGEWCGCGSKNAPAATTTTKSNAQPTQAQGGSNTNFCSVTKHSGTSVTETSNKVGSINGIGYELWSDSGNNSATFYSDGSFSCSFRNAKDYLCRTGLSFDSTKTHSQIGHMYADFKLVKQNIQNVDYSYVGIYGWTRNPLVEFYVVDNWLSQYRPGDWVGNKKHGDFTIDGAKYTVYENTRYGPSIDGNTNFKQYFSIRQQPRDCGTIDITAHFQQWEKLGMTMGKMHEAKVLGEAGSTGSGTSGTADFPYAKVYIK